ncbi:hypothetical protein MNBD_CHLOROFLEXI01-2983 [hydrothermal vent metagenome]|uniref:Uncharacterized protein n=1 Tax=hydrothermal vent metagenome TaxID=652676 RepID=A0A3B0VPH7_9ZZZZ
MTTSLFRQTDTILQAKTNRYEKFGFSRNPFPTKPSVTISSPDPRENGEIYLSDLRQKEQGKFEELLIPRGDRSQVRSIAFLMDYATRRGRGIGKTSFLFHQRERIMADLGNELSRGSQVLFSTYVLPQPNGVHRKFWQFCKLIMESLASDDNPIISMAMWRLRAFSGVIPDSVLEQVGESPEQTIGDDKWLQKHDVNVFFSLNNAIKRQLLGLGINEVLADALTNYGHLPIKFQQNFLSKISDSTWRVNGVNYLFDDLVKLFRVAGFTKGLILVDEMEKVIRPQNSKERRAFTDALRYFLIDGQCENARLSFYSFFFTIHPYIQELLNPHWEATGLDRFAALSRELAPEYTVYFHPLDQNSARPLAKVYLDESRLSGKQEESFAPFTTEALDEALFKSGRVPGKYLTLLNQAVERAIKEGWETIDANEINRVLQLKAPGEPGEKDATDALPLAIDLGSNGN